MSEVRITVVFEHDEAGFSRDKVYEVLAIEDHQLLLVDDDARLVWLGPERVTPREILRGTERLFDLDIHRQRRRLESMAGKRVLLTTWENLGFEPDEVNQEGMLIYRGVVTRYDGETLFLDREGDDQGSFGVLPKAIATIDEIA